jgi:hypothetical protein
MSEAPWFGEKNVVAGLLAGFFGGKKNKYFVNYRMFGLRFGTWLAF